MQRSGRGHQHSNPNPTPLSPPWLFFFWSSQTCLQCSHRHTHTQHKQHGRGKNSCHYWTKTIAEVWHTSCLYAIGWKHQNHVNYLKSQMRLPPFVSSGSINRTENPAISLQPALQPEQRVSESYYWEPQVDFQGAPSSSHAQTLLKRKLQSQCQSLILVRQTETLQQNSGLKSAEKDLCSGLFTLNVYVTARPLAAALLRALRLSTTRRTKLPQRSVTVLDAWAHPLWIQLSWKWKKRAIRSVRRQRSKTAKSVHTLSSYKS